MKKGHNGRKSLRRLKPTVGCNASKRRRRYPCTSFFTLLDENIHNIRLGLRAFGVLFCVAGLVFPDVSKQNCAFIFKVRV
jgi:hypothetical protein